MKTERLEIYWQERMVGFFDRKHSDVGHYLGIWVPSESELTSEFEKLLLNLQGNDKHWRGVVISYQKTGSRTRHFGLVHNFGDRALIDNPNEMSVCRMTTDKLVGLLQCQGIVDLGSSPESE